ncbi:hypothetical protein QCA50_004428 [Cerrena zonata]|uniref:Amidohydrolase 3 domain-containing protein n=1 Tax=Cerrena zonata TaxID=2478898 RepID=A0AAW0GP05_9APHY
MSTQISSQELRKRTPSSSPAGRPGKETSSLTKPLKDTRSYGFRAIISLVVVATLLATFSFRDSSSPGATGLPHSYALCSPDGRIITVDETKSEVECLVVTNSHFSDVGSLDDVLSRWADVHSTSLPVRYTKPGTVVVPGLSDSHAHILEYGATVQLPLEGTSTVSDTVKLIRNFILADPDLRNDRTKTIEGWGWDHTKWTPERWPTADDMEQDPVVRGRPISLQSKDGHTLWVSQKILDSITPMPDEVEGGTIIRDSNGKPIGIFLDSAQDLIKVPEPSHDVLEKRFALAVRDAHASGLTSIHDAGFNPRSLAFYRKQAEKGTLPLRVYGMAWFNHSAEYLGDRVEKIIGAGGGRLNVRSVKIFADGALRSGGAALYEPYTDNPETRGFMRIEPELLNKVVPRFLRDGWQVNVHAIGDRANGIVLDAFEAALKDVDVSALRPRLEHAQILSDKDMARFGDLGVIASIQPTHAISDMWFGEDRLGPERVKGLYAFRSILDHGARITLGSDFPVETMNPLSGFYAAVTRLSPDGKSPHGPNGWFPEQRITREIALKGMTLDPAYASFSENDLGSITPGKRADYVVFSRDIMTIPANQILEVKVLATVIDGRPVFGHI